MSTFSIPDSQGQIRQSTRSDNRGEIVESFNINLNKKFGKISVSERMDSVFGGTIAERGDVRAFALYKAQYYCICSSANVQKASVVSDLTDPASWTDETGISAGDIDDMTDAIVFDDLLLYSDDTQVTSWDGATDDSTWWSTNFGSALTANNPHTMHVHRGGQETLFVTDENKIKYINFPSGTPNPSTITLQTDLIACCVASGVSAVWVGTYSESSNSAYVYEVYVGETSPETGSPIARNAYKIDGRAVLAIEVVGNTPYIVTDRGNIQQFNGAGFVTVASFPFAGSNTSLNGVRPAQTQPESNRRVINPKGMQLHNDSLYINLANDLSGNDFLPDTPGGVWEFNHVTKQLNHRFSFSNDTTDFGGVHTDRTGPLLIVDDEETFLLAGSGQEGDIVNYMYATNSNTNQSWFITKEIESGTIEDAYEAVYHKAKTLASGESINTLYRTSKRDTIYGTANWTGTNTFNTTDDWSNVAEGELVRISYDYAAGEWATITKIETSATVYSITLNRDIGADTETSLVYSDNFKLIDDEYTTADGEYKKVGVGETSPWIQFMVILKGDIEYRQFISKGNSKTQL